jgi:DNA-binding CsgD family transcriptional regulator
MRISEEVFTGLVARLYEAGFGRADWYEPMEAIRAAFGGAGSVIFDLHPESGRISNWFAPGLTTGDRYAEEANAINPRMKFSLAAPLGHIAWDYRFIPEPEMDRHDFYHWTRQTGDMKYFLGTRLFDDPKSNTSAFTSIEFARRHGHVSRRQIEIYTKLRGHMANAWSLSRLAQRSQATDQIRALMESQAGCGIVVLDSVGAIHSANDRAAAILRQNDGLAIRNGLLVARHASETRRLRELLRTCCSTSRTGFGSAGGAVAITRGSAQPRYIVRAMPVTAASHPRPADLPAVIVTITDPALPIGIRPEVLSDLYGLSRREADLAVQLSAGLALREAASAAGMRYNTARNHIRPIFQKTGASNQLQLVNILRGLNALK